MAENSYLLNQMARPVMSSTSPFSQVGAPLDERIISLA